MDPRPLRGLLISDFNVQNLAGYLDNDAGEPRVRAHVAPYGQVEPALLDRGHQVWREDHDFAVVWTTPSGAAPSFKGILEHVETPLAGVLEEVDLFAERLASLLDRVRFVFVPTWVAPSHDRGLGLLDLKTGPGLSNTVMRMNLRLIEASDKTANLHLLNTSRWLTRAGRDAFVPKLWYMAKVAFGNEVLREAARDIKAGLTTVLGGARKLIVLDLDNTLWGGIVGDAGWENLQLGGHDPIGEGFVDFQRALKALTRRGILLAIASKNDEAVALEAIRRHPEMVLKEEDFAGWRIHWGDKAQSLESLAEELNLGLQSMIMIDDSPVERARIREGLPEVLVPDWPAESMHFKSALLSIPELDTVSVSAEDAARSRMYAAERLRREARSSLPSLEEWIESLDLRVEATPLQPSNLQRATQLLNKTNQMNLSTRRLTESELVSWAEGEGRSAWTFAVRDKFADYGLTGLLSLEIENDTARIVDYVLSCRVMGRKIEETLLHAAITEASSRGAKEVTALFLPTKKNMPCLAFLRASGMDGDQAALSFRWDTAREFPLPKAVRLTRHPPEGRAR